MDVIWGVHENVTSHSPLKRAVYCLELQLIFIARQKNYSSPSILLVFALVQFQFTCSRAVYLVHLLSSHSQSFSCSPVTFSQQFTSLVFINCLHYGLLRFLHHGFLLVERGVLLHHLARKKFGRLQRKSVCRPTPNLCNSIPDWRNQCPLYDKRISFSSRWRIHHA